MAPRQKEESLSSRLKKLSKEELNKRDCFGRTILHVICIVGRYDLLKHLLKNPHLNSAVTDYESGWTGLHYSINYGRLSCSRLLLDHNYDLVKIKDRSGLTAMDIYHSKYSLRDLKIFQESIGENDTNYTQRFSEEDGVKAVKPQDKLIWWDRERGGSEVFTFGSNINNQLGTGDSIDKSSVPYRININNFRLEDHTLSIADRLVPPRVKDIKLSKNHSIILTNEEKNNILIAGNSSRGRLGNRSTLPNFRFSHMDFFEDKHIIDVALSDDHTLALTSDGDVYSWGLNNYYELGYATEKIKEKTDTYSDEPRRVLGALKRLKIRGIACSRVHSCAYVDDCVIFWGLNVGQMDFISTGETVRHGKLKGIPQIPRQVRFNSTIKQVIATDDSTIVLLNTNECHVFIQGNHLKFQLPLHKTLNNEFEFFRPSVFSRRKQIIKLVAKDSTKIGILYDDGSVMNFGVDMFTKSSNVKYSPVWTPRNDHLKCTDVDIGKDGSIIICTKSGCVYKRVPRGGSNSFKFNKIEKISKVVKVSCDSLFSSFGFIKDDVDQLPMKLYKNKFLKDIAYLSPLSVSSQNRKHLELVDPSLCYDYTANFLYRPNIEIEDDEYDALFKRDLRIEDEKADSKISDPVFDAYKTRWQLHQPLKTTMTKYDKQKYLELVSEEDLKTTFISSDFTTGKGYDLTFEVDGCSVGVHSSVLFFIESFQSINETDLVIDDITFHKVETEGVIHVDGLQLHSLLLILHLLYTGDMLRPWESSPSSLFFQNIKVEFEKVMRRLKLTDDLKRSIYDFSSNFKNVDNFEADTTILLKDGEELTCCSYIIKARNAYFETYFSERWDKNNVLEFQHVSKKVFQLLLDYIHGHEQLSLLDKFYDITNSANFINITFELIELSDELLLFGLKNFCQLMIKDFIKQENVLLILHHAEILNCRELAGQCFWFIYNNVETFLTDQDYEELVSDNMIKRIDSYCRWLHRVNKIKPEDAKSAWYDGNSTDLIKKYLNDIREFNDIFLESDNFVPLFDIPSKNKSPKLEPKKTSKLPSPSPTPSPVVSEKMRNASINSIINLNQTSSRKSSFSDSSAIEFTDDDFQPVINSRRRKSSSTKPGSQFVQPGSSQSTPSRSSSIGVTPSRSQSIPINTPSSSANKLRKQSIDFSRQSWAENNSSPVGLSPFSNWASPGNSNGNGSSSNGSTTNGSYLFSSQWVNSPPAKGPSVFASAPRLSQKERKKMLKQNDDLLKQETNNSKSSSPWKVPTATSVGSSSKSPSLASAREEELQAAKPSLKGIIHEEEHKIYETQVKATERKSLVEVQQEEEFALWWEEESRKVQSQLNAQNLWNGQRHKQALLDGNNTASRQLNGHDKKSHNSKRKQMHDKRKKSTA